MKTTSAKVAGILLDLGLLIYSVLVLFKMRKEGGGSRFPPPLERVIAQKDHSANGILPLGTRVNWTPLKASS